MSGPDDLLERLHWSDELAMLEADAPVAELLALLAVDGPWYILIRRAPDLLYAFTREELTKLPLLGLWRREEPPLGAVVADALGGLHEEDSSPRVARDGAALPHPYGPPPHRQPAQSRKRRVLLDDVATPLAVGEAPGHQTLGTARPRRFDPAPPREAAPAPADAMGADLDVALADPREAAPAPADPMGADEGRNPQRHPVILADGPLQPGAAVQISVDLARQPDPATRTAGVELGEQATDWSEIAVQVEVQAAGIAFAEPAGTILVRRNADSVPAIFQGEVLASAAGRAEVSVAAFFSLQGRDCGAARRRFPLTAAAARPAPPPAPVVLDRQAVAPLLTVRVIRNDPEAPGRLTWSYGVGDRDAVAGLGRLSEIQMLDSSTEAWAQGLYASLGALQGPNFLKKFTAYGKTIWEHTPPLFKQVYWALRDRHGDGFPIQFITDEPLIPWELLRPTRPDTPDTRLLALTHPVARWPAAFEAGLRQALPGGDLVSIAPAYVNPMDELDWAQAETDWLIKHLGAVPYPGASAAQLEALLRDGRAEGPVAVLHFAGHGDTTPGRPDEARLKLADGGWLEALDVSALDASALGAAGPLVVLNACKVGQPAEMLGVWGGWVPVLLQKAFRGVIAPLWPVFDEHAAEVSKSLLTALADGEAVGPVMQRIREQHGADSPTFLAYLYYGDVFARRGPPVQVARDSRDV